MFAAQQSPALLDSTIIPPRRGGWSEAEKVALEYSELMQFNPEEIDEAFYDRLREHYTEAEIVEPGAFIGFNVGYRTFFRTLDFYPMFSPDGRLVSQEESRRIYGTRLVSHLQGALARAAVEAGGEQPEGAG